jgi:dUTP pyrophosphatase
MIGGVYLAYPIDQRGPASLAYLFDQIEHIKKLLLDYNVASWVFDPGDAFRVNLNAKPNDTIARINRNALYNADVIVAFLPRGVPTVGVPMELSMAWSAGKHIVLFSDAGESWSLQWRDGQGRMARYADWSDQYIEDAVGWIGSREGHLLDPYDHPTSELRVRLDDPAAQLPRRAYSDDAGLDLIVSEDTVVPLGEFVDVPCGLSLELPPHTWGLVTGRSSALRTHGLLVHSGVIDAGYRGPIFAGAFAMQGEVALKAGDRIAQLIVLHNTTQNVNVMQVDALSPSARGERGFGSSGA